MSRYFTNVKNTIEERVNTSYIDELYTKDAQGEFRKIVAGESGGDNIELPEYIKEDNIDFNTDGETSATKIAGNGITTYMTIFEGEGKLTQLTPTELWHIDPAEEEMIHTTYPHIINAANKLAEADYLREDAIIFNNKPNQRFIISSVSNNMYLASDSIHVGSGSAQSTTNRSLIKSDSLFINGAITSDNTQYRNKEIIIDNATKTINLVDLQDSQEKYLKSDKIEFANGSGLSADGLSYKEGSTTITKTIKEVLDAVDNSGGGGVVLPGYLEDDYIEFTTGNRKMRLDEDKLKAQKNINGNWYNAEYSGEDIKYDLNGVNPKYISLDSLVKATRWYHYVSDPTSTTQNTAFKLGPIPFPTGKSITVFDGNRVAGSKIMVELAGYTPSLINGGTFSVEFEINFGASTSTIPFFKASLMNIKPTGAAIEDANKLYIGSTYTYTSPDTAGNTRCRFIIHHPQEVEVGTETVVEVNQIFEIEKIYVLLEFGIISDIPTNFFPPPP